MKRQKISSPACCSDDSRMEEAHDETKNALSLNNQTKKKLNENVNGAKAKTSSNGKLRPEMPTNDQRLFPYTVDNGIVIIICNLNPLSEREKYV